MIYATLKHAFSGGPFYYKAVQNSESSSPFSLNFKPGAYHKSYEFITLPWFAATRLGLSRAQLLCHVSYFKTLRVGRI